MKVHFHFSFGILVPQSGGILCRHKIHLAWSSMWYFHSQWHLHATNNLLKIGISVITGDVVIDDLKCHAICLWWFSALSEVHSQHSHLPENFQVFHVFFYWKDLWRGWLNFFSRIWHLPTFPKVRDGPMHQWFLSTPQTHLGPHIHAEIKQTTDFLIYENVYVTWFNFVAM